MANSLNIQVIQDGPRHSVLKVEGVLNTVSDIATGTRTVIADPSTMIGMDNTGTVKAQDLIIDRIQFAIEDGIEVNLEWVATTNSRIAELVGRGTEKYDRFGGLFNNSGAGRTGQIALWTEGLGTGQTKSFTVILEMKKQGRL